MKRRLSLLAAALATTVLLATGCTENPVGRKCFIGEIVDAGVPNQAIVASPALECPSRTCLRTPLDPGKALPEDGELSDLCTAECSTSADCDKVPESPCVGGFTCTIPVVVGPFCCRKLCVCKDYLIIPDGGLGVPAACDPGNELNTCCNLKGREDSPLCSN